MAASSSPTRVYKQSFLALPPAVNDCSPLTIRNSRPIAGSKTWKAVLWLETPIPADPVDTAAHLDGAFAVDAARDHAVPT